MKTTLLINPPPTDLCCEICGCKDQEIMKTFRSMAPASLLRNSPIEKEYQIEHIKRESDPNKEPLDEWASKFYKYAENKYGEEKVKEWDIIQSAIDTISASWECKNCIGLDEDEAYNKKIAQIKGDEK